MKIEVLVSTMNDESMDLYTNMNISTDFLVSNQGNRHSSKEDNYRGNRVRSISTQTRGLARSRNILLSSANNDICLIADDDIKYHDNYETDVLDAFKKYPDADLLLFNLDNMGGRFVIKEDFKVNTMTYQRFGSVRIAFKLKSILKNDIRFNELFGAGSFYTSGEDTLFLKDCLSARLNIVAVNKSIGLLTDNRDSTWFEGYNYKYFFDKGALFKAAYPISYLFWILQFSIRKKKTADKDIRSFIQIFKIMSAGSKGYSDGLYYKDGKLIDIIDNGDC